MERHQRFRSAREAAGLTLERVAAHFGISYQAVQQWESPSGTMPRGKRLSEVANLYRTTISYLLDEKGISEPKPDYNVSPGPDLSSRLIPVIDWVAAGTFCEITDPFEPGTADEWASPPIKAHSKHTYALRVSGESMYNPGGKPSFMDQDLIYVDPEAEPRNGSCVVVRLEDDDKATLKQLIIEGNQKYLKALNPSWPDRIIKVNSNATICGVVIGKWEDV